MNTSVMRDGHISPRITEALKFACDAAGLNPANARLLRMHSNTVFYLPRSRAVARIAPAGTDTAARVAASLTATEWLARQGFPTVRPAAGRAVKHDGLVVSFWAYEETTPASRSMAALAALLRDLHAFTDVNLDLPVMPSPLGSVTQAVREHPDAFDGSDRDWLANEVRKCERKWATMPFTLPSGLVHGDAHPNNMIYTRRGALLGDWDHVSFGPREWDLVQSVYFHRRFPAPGDDLDCAADTYGWDIRAWPAVDDLVSIREVSGLGSYIRTAAAKPGTRTELAYRIETLRTHDVTAIWNSPSSS